VDARELKEIQSPVNVRFSNASSPAPPFKARRASHHSVTSDPG